ncbi:MAG TPA: ribonuclease Z [Methanobacteriaceae archaeon]|nr:ribonuclease Z [Methanobacteriaceae archaeon]HNS25578.1 ribonuclease Z [Methanobacteriaceae archaeon]
MELVFLGTSSAIPTNHRNHPALALKAFGELMLFDCGEGTQRQMTRIRMSPMKVKRIFITHLHGDHFLGLPGLIQSMAFRGREDPLYIYGPSGTGDVVESIKKLGYFSLSFPIITQELYQGVFLEEDSYRISCCPVQHSVLNLAYSVEERRAPKFLREKALELGLTPGPDFGKLQRGTPVKVGERTIQPQDVLGKKRRGRKIVYSGDTRACREMVNLAKDADVLIHESTFDASQEEKALTTGHSTSKSAARVAALARVGRLILTHLSTRYRDAKKLEKEASEIFPEVTVAEDFMSVEVKLRAD